MAPLSSLIQAAVWIYASVTLIRPGRDGGRRGSSTDAAVEMGNSRSSALSKELLEELKSSTRYGEAELCSWYRAFLRECPGGRISREQFEGIYASFFPDADPSQYARHVFRSFDTNADGTLDFKEYMVALHLTSGGKTLQKLEWAFALYDVDGNGTISKNEILEIVRVAEPSHFPQTEIKTGPAPSGGGWGSRRR